MFEPIYDDLQDEFGECTYNIIGYEVEETPTIVTAEDSMQDLVESATGRTTDELLDYGKVTVLVERKRYSLEDFITLPIKKFIGKEVIFECDYEE